MILLGEAFYCCCESLNLSLKGDGAWFVPLIVIGGRHRASKYHATFVWKAVVWLTSYLSHRRCQIMMPKIVSKPHSPHVLYTKTCTTKKKKNPTKSTDVVPAKDPPKVKLENFHYSSVPELG